MTLSDYTENRGSWVATQPIATPLGSLTVRLEPGRRTAPDADMLKRADVFVALARATVDGIHDKIFAHYQQRLASDPDWLETCGVPANLDRAGVLTYLEGQALVVRRDPDLDDPFVCRYSATPAWDEEHGISLYHEAGRWKWDDDDDNDDEAPPRGQAPRSRINKQFEKAVLHRKQADIERYLTSGLDVNDLGPGDVPPLWTAVSAMNVPLVERLLAMGADVSLPFPGSQMTALQLAKALYPSSGFDIKAKRQALDEIVRLLDAAGRQPKS